VCAHLEVSEEDLKFLDGKTAMLEIQDIKDDNWHPDINIGEGIADIRLWTALLRPYVENTCYEHFHRPAALIMIQNDDIDEIQRTLRYLEMILPKLKM
jgi:hypothetical protein